MAIAAPIPTVYPRGVIVISVQDQTAGNSGAKANTSESPLSVVVGDKLQYVIRITNKGQNTANNALVNTVLSDDLPANLALADNSDPQQITTTVGTIEPGSTITKTYTVTVNSGTSGDIIKNEACFTGNSKTGGSPQKGCDDVYVKIAAPQHKGPLPNTGMSVPLVILLTIGSSLGAYLLKLWDLRRNHQTTQL